MRRLIGLFILLTLGFWGQPASAQGLLGGLLSTVSQVLSGQNQQQGVIVRTTLGRAGLQNACLSNGCTVVGNLDGNANQVFLVRPAQGLLAATARGCAETGERNSRCRTRSDSDDSTERK